MKEKRIRFALSLLLAVAIVLTLSFIFGNSALPQKESAELSGRLLSLLQSIFGKDNAFARFLATYIRKLAHFAEFGLLAFEVFLLSRVRHFPPLPSALLSLPLGFLVAAADETLQIFTGRGASFIDVLIDFCGFATVTAVTYLAVKLCRKRKENKNATV